MTPRNYIKSLVAGEDKATVLKPNQFKDLMLLSGEGRNGIRNRSIIWHSFASGLRVSEIAKLKTKDVVNKSGGIVEIGRLPGASAKGGKSRLFIQLEQAQHDAIEAYIGYRIGKGLRCTDKRDYSGLQGDSPFYLSRGSAGFQMTRKQYERANGKVEEYEVCSSLQQLITSLIKRVGVKGGSSHSGRRTLSTRLHNRGVDDGLIQIILGHAEVNITMSYMDPDVEKIKKGFKTLFAGLPR